jgi:hypothetical protein
MIKVRIPQQASGWAHRWLTKLDFEAFLREEDLTREVFSRRDAQTWAIASWPEMR